METVTLPRRAYEDLKGRYWDTVDMVTEAENELAECREKLAAAEAREREYEKLHTIVRKIDGTPAEDIQDSDLLIDLNILLMDAEELGICERRHTALEAALEQARADEVAPYVAAFSNADIHTDKLPEKNGARLMMLIDEVEELTDSLEGHHEHPPEWELSQIAGIAINWLRAIGKVPPPRRDIPAEVEQARAEGYKQGQDDYHANVVKPYSDISADAFRAGQEVGAAEERERCAEMMEHKANCYLGAVRAAKTDRAKKLYRRLALECGYAAHDIRNVKEDQR